MKVYGRFYFELTVNGNLLGEYSNRNSQWVDVEAARRISGSQAGPSEGSPVAYGFVGDYNSVWTEGESNVMHGILTIGRKNVPGEIFEVTWSSSDRRRELFVGEAMLVNAKLIGDYHSVDESRLS